MELQTLTDRIAKALAIRLDGKAKFSTEGDPQNQYNVAWHHDIPDDIKEDELAMRYVLPTTGALASRIERKSEFTFLPPPPISKDAAISVVDGVAIRGERLKDGPAVLRFDVFVRQG